MLVADIHTHLAGWGGTHFGSKHWGGRGRRIFLNLRPTWTTKWIPGPRSTEKSCLKQNKQTKPNQPTQHTKHFRHHHLLTANSTTRPCYHLLAFRILKVYSLGKLQTRHTPFLVLNAMVLTGSSEFIYLIIPGSYPLTNISHSQLPEPRELPFYSMSTSLFFLSTHERLYNIYFPMNVYFTEHNNIRVCPDCRNTSRSTHTTFSLSTNTWGVSTWQCRGLLEVLDYMGSLF